MDDVRLQLRLLIIMCGAGFFIGLLYDIFRLFRGIFRPKRLFTAITDLIFWVFVTITICVALVYSNYGELRVGGLVGIVIGVLIYFNIFSSWIIRGLFVVVAMRREKK
jgi:spore cortex biosynthesis protein YabQ